MATYNDEDITREVIDHYISQGIELVVLDHMSNDGTYEICKHFADDGKIKLSRYQSTKWEWITMKRALYDFALMQNPDWVLLIGSDEFIESTNNRTLSEEITIADTMNCNIIGCDLFDFYPTEADDANAKSIRHRMRYYSYRPSQLLLRAWKCYIGTEVQTKSFPIFPDYQPYKIYQDNLILRHYSFRGEEHATKKIAERHARGNATVDSRLGHYTQYDNAAALGVLRDFRQLSEYKNDNRWNYDVKVPSLEPPNQNTRKDVFTEDGFLKVDLTTFAEVLEALKNTRTRNNELQAKLKQKTYVI
jgi:glycosyltransferase involved in cell wall biosynthesis